MYICRPGRFENEAKNLVYTLTRLIGSETHVALRKAVLQVAIDKTVSVSLIEALNSVLLSPSH